MLCRSSALNMILVQRCRLHALLLVSELFAPYHDPSFTFRSRMRVAHYCARKRVAKTARLRTFPKPDLATAARNKSSTGRAVSLQHENS